MQPADLDAAQKTENLERFARELTNELQNERARHAKTAAKLEKALKAESALADSMRKLQREWKARKQSWHASHKRHVVLRAKYTKLLDAVQGESHRREQPRQEPQRQPSPPPPVAVRPRPPAAAAQQAPVTPAAPPAPAAITAAPPPPATTRPAPPLERRQVEPPPPGACASCLHFFQATGVRVDCNHASAPPPISMTLTTPARRHAPIRMEPSTPDDFWGPMSFGDGGGAPSPAPLTGAVRRRQPVRLETFDEDADVSRRSLLAPRTFARRNRTTLGADARARGALGQHDISSR